MQGEAGLTERRVASRRTIGQIGLRRESYGRRPLEISLFMEELSRSWKDQETLFHRKGLKTVHLVALYIYAIAATWVIMEVLQINPFKKGSSPISWMEASYHWAGYHRVSS
jgi:hypothetical protein